VVVTQPSEWEARKGREYNKDHEELDKSLEEKK
jgi:hypothetical protein